MGFRPIRFPFVPGREWHAVLERVNIYGNQNTACLGGKYKNLSSLSYGRGLEINSPQGLFFLPPTRPSSRPAPFRRLLFLRRCSQKNSVALAWSHALPQFWGRFLVWTRCVLATRFISSHNSEGGEG